MIDKIWRKHLAVAALCFGGIGTVIYVLMINLTLAHIETVSGQVPFDMRPLGYSSAEATDLLAGLGAEGRRYYLTRQIPLDTAYPALLALTLVSLLRWIGQRLLFQRFVKIGIVLSVGAALFDYSENLGIVAMILTWPDLSVPLVYASSVATVAKSILTTSAVMIVLLTLGPAGRNHMLRTT